MHISAISRQRQTGAYLLEALIGILIFGLGILGIVGLQAASLRTTSDSSLRAAQTRRPLRVHPFSPTTPQVVKL